MFRTRSAIHTRRVHLSIRGAAEAAVEREGRGGLLEGRRRSSPTESDRRGFVRGLKWDPAMQMLPWPLASFDSIVTFGGA